MAKESTNGMMADSMKDNGKIIKCTEKAPLPGQTAENMSVNMLMTKNMVTENLSGLINDHIKATGKMENNMAKAFTEQQMATKNMENGKKGNEYVGS